MNFSNFAYKFWGYFCTPLDQNMTYIQWALKFLAIFDALFDFQNLIMIL